MTPDASKEIIKRVFIENLPTGILGGNVYDHSGNLVVNPHCVIDTATIGGGGTVAVTLTGNAVFKSATSYTIIAIDNTGAAAVEITQTSGSQFTITGTAGHVVRYIAIGN